MNSIIELVIFFVSSFASSQIDPILLAEQWEDEVLYFNPDGKTESFEWSGIAYNTKEKKCYRLKQKPKAKKVEARAAKCEKDFLVRATEQYRKFDSFQKYKAKLVECLGSNNKTCLRPLISKTIKISFGDDGYGDRRDLVFAKWTDADYERVKKLLEKGVISEGDYKRFPPNPTEDGVGYRGHFENKNGSWVLASFVIGD